jgi:hypothetical protein
MEMQSRTVCMALVAAMLLLFCTAVQGSAGQAKPATGVAAKAVANPGVVKYSSGMPASVLAKRPDTDLVELSNGRRIRLGDIRRLKAAAARIRATAPGSKLPKAFRIKPAATGTRLANSADLSAALKRSDNETVVLPSGRRTTVGMIRLLQPEVEKRLGRPLSAAATPLALSGPAIHVNAKSDWKTILGKPDGTVLEAPNGKRITVGELKQALAASTPTLRLPPAKR